MASLGKVFVIDFLASYIWRLNVILIWCSLVCFYWICAIHRTEAVVCYYQSRWLSTQHWILSHSFD